MTYHLSRNGQPTGTCTKEEAIARYARGELLPTDLVWCEGMANWTPASQVFGGSIPPPVSGASMVQPPAPPTLGDAGKPANLLVFAILATLFCCIPTGIAAIIYAAQVDSKWSRGDREGALAAAKNAKIWCWVSVGAGLLGTLIYVAFMVVAAASTHGY